MSAVAEHAPAHTDAHPTPPAHPEVHAVEVHKDPVAVVPVKVEHGSADHAPKHEMTEKEKAAEAVVTHALAQEASHEAKSEHASEDAHKETASEEEADPFKGNAFTFKEKFWRLFSPGVTISDKEKKPVLHAFWKPLRFRDAISIVAEKAKDKELLRIAQRNFIDAGAMHTVSEGDSNEMLGGIKRNWWKSMLRKEWTLYDKASAAIGKIQESSWRRALLSRLSGGVIPQKYAVMINDGNDVAEIKQHMTIFRPQHTLTIKEGQPLDTRLLVSAGLLVARGESKEKE